MKLIDDDIFDGESIIQTKKANAVIKVDEYGLKKFGFDKFLSIYGMKGKDAIGGKIYLTNYRLIFKSHWCNRVSGKFSIFLPTIKGVKNTSKLITRKMEVRTDTQRFEFVVWGPSAFISQIKAVKDAISQEQIEFIHTNAAKDYKKCGEGLKVFKTLNKISDGVMSIHKLPELLEKD
ncbi:GRAM domain-containing protein [Desulfococcaceae bacterium HSG7]|nr:GRAM domain-containing protein [Desulfococcaceae bacterium HSG7]